MRTETSFLKGTLLLTLSGVTVKIFGAVFRIILTNYVGSAAMGFYSSA
jgi:O-antigen/teichoic acid export membrane protein